MVLSDVAPAQVVEAMRRGVSPRDAAEQAIARIARYVPGYYGALVAVDKHGNHAGAAFGCAGLFFTNTCTSSGVATCVLRLFHPCFSAPLCSQSLHVSQFPAG